MQSDDSILIAGAGPVGCILALMLARAGIPVTLLERFPELPEDLRASTFHPPTLDMMSDLGLFESLRDVGLIAPTYQYRDRQSGVHAVFDLQLLADETRHPYRLQCEQFKLTRVVCGLLAGFPHVRILMGHVLMALNQQPDHVDVQVTGPEGPQELRATFVVGTDGARSAVRSAMGVPFDGMTYPEKFLVVSTGAPLADLLPGLSAVNYVADATEWCTILKTRDLWRVLFPADAEQPEADLLSDAEADRRLRALTGSDRSFDVQHRTLYRVHQRVARTFRVGRVLLAGDAAHVNNPLGGMGMNGGIHDAVSLGQALIANREAPDDPSALDRYAFVRRRIAAEFINEQTARNKRLMEERDPERRRAHLREMLETAADPRLAKAYLMRSSMIDSLRRAEELDERVRMPGAAVQ
jgi:3-(3-hydroxy-phenyl)propionate hydroxylase